MQRTRPSTGDDIPLIHSAEQLRQFVNRSASQTSGAPSRAGRGLTVFACGFVLMFVAGALLTQYGPDWDTTCRDVSYKLDRWKDKAGQAMESMQTTQADNDQYYVMDSNGLMRMATEEEKETLDFVPINEVFKMPERPE